MQSLPPIDLVRSVTVSTILSGISMPSSSMAEPSYVHRVPGTSGNHGLVPCVGLVNFAGSNASCEVSLVQWTAEAAVADVADSAAAAGGAASCFFAQPPSRPRPTRAASSPRPEAGAFALTLFRELRI